MKRVAAIVVFLLFSLVLLGQGRVVLSGFVKDEANGETLAGASIFTADKSVGVGSDEHGFYSISLPAREQTVKCSYFGYETIEIKINPAKTKRYDFSLKVDNQTLEAATVFSKSKREELRMPQMSKEFMDAPTLKKIPTLLGENDIIRAIQMLPGVQAPSEGSTGFSVRGGGTDQNLVLMDGAPLYNAGHFLGFFSMFNGDAVKNAEIYKGDFPARYGGRMSSVLNVSTKDGNLNRFEGNASIGLISSKINVQGPIVKNKLSFSLSARRTYLDMFFPIFKGKIPSGSKLNFWDANARLSWVIGPNDRLYLSAFSGRDVFGMAMEEFNLDNMMFAYMNNAQTLRWNHIYNSALTSNIVLYNSRYDSSARFEYSEAKFDYKQQLREVGLRAGWNWTINETNKLNFGANFSFHRIDPGKTIPDSALSLVTSVVMPLSFAISPAVYVEDEQILGPVTLRAGLRFSAFSTMGPTDQRYFDPVTHELADVKAFESGQFIQSYCAPEPRASVSWSVNKDLSFKASYSRSCQYIQQAMISITGSPLDTWLTASPNIKPQISNQLSVGGHKLFLDGALDLSVEAFCKLNRNTPDFRDNPGLVVDNINREGLLRFGRSYGYGAELLLKYDFARWSGWIGYTWSKMTYDIPEINGGKPYASPLNHEHAINFLLSYDFSRQWSASGSWVFYSGAATTFPVGRFSYLGKNVPIYSGRGEDRMPDYHRMDLSLTFRTKERVQQKRWSGEWNLSLYNAYAHHNAWSLAFGVDKETGEPVARKVYLFSIVPSVSYNIKF